MGKQKQLPSSKSDTPLTDADEKREVAYIARHKNLQYADVLTVYREAVSIHPFPSREDRIAFTEKLLNYQKMTERKLRANPPTSRAPYKIRVKPEDGALDITFFPPEEDSYEDIRTALEAMRDTESTTVFQMPRNPAERAKQLEYIMQHITPEQVEGLAKSLKTAKGHEDFAKFIAGCRRKLK